MGENKIEVPFFLDWILRVLYNSSSKSKILITFRIEGKNCLQVSSVWSKETSCFDKGISQKVEKGWIKLIQGRPSIRSHSVWQKINCSVMPLILPLDNFFFFETISERPDRGHVCQLIYMHHLITCRATTLIHHFNDFVYWSTIAYNVLTVNILDTKRWQILNLS